MQAHTEKMRRPGRVKNSCHGSAVAAGVIALMVAFTGSFNAVTSAQTWARSADSSTSVAHHTAAPVAVGVQFHGMWENYTDAERGRALRRIKGAGATWVRLDVSWAMIQPRPGSVDRAWGVPYVDRVIRMARAQGLKVLVTLWRTPAWANGGASETTPPTDPADYAAALRWAAQHWAGTVDHWEVWNEPNLDDYSTGASAASYTKMLCAAYRAVKASTPTARIVFGGTMYSDTPWIARAYRTGAKGCFDIMAVHPYTGPADASPLARSNGEIWDFRHLGAVRRLMLRHHDRKPIWITEFGWSTHVNTPRTQPWDRGVTDQQQAAYAVAALRLLHRKFPYVRKAFWYNERNLETGAEQLDNYGLTASDLHPKPAWYAIRRHLATR